MQRFFEGLLEQARLHSGRSLKQGSISEFTDEIFIGLESIRFSRKQAASFLEVSLPTISAAWKNIATKGIGNYSKATVSILDLHYFWKCCPKKPLITDCVSKLIHDFIKVENENLEACFAVNELADRLCRLINPKKLSRVQAAKRLQLSLPTFDRMRSESGITEYYLIGRKRKKWARPHFHPREIDQIIERRNWARHFSRMWEA